MRTNALTPVQQPFGRHDVPRVDFQMHTTWTDGRHTSREMYDSAVEAGLEAIAFTEHVRKTSGDWYPRFAAEIRALPDRPCRAHVAVETRVATFAGDLDCTEEILAECDLVLASVHRFPDAHGNVRGFDDVPADEAEDIEFELAMAVAGNPRVDVLSHPFGMCLKRYGVTPSEARVRQLIERVAETGVAFEVNASYHPDPWQWIDWCRQAGAPLSLGSDAHSREQVGRIVRVLEGREAPWMPSGS